MIEIGILFSLWFNLHATILSNRSIDVSPLEIVPNYKAFRSSPRPHLLLIIQ